MPITSAESKFVGHWTTTRSGDSNKPALPMNVTTHGKGSYESKGGGLDGKFTDSTTFEGKWAQTDKSGGDFKFTLKGTDEFTGTYTYLDIKSNTIVTGTWNGTRVR
jgi:hypothetical protein